MVSGSGGGRGGINIGSGVMVVVQVASIQSLAVIGVTEEVGSASVTLTSTATQWQSVMLLRSRNDHPEPGHSRFTQ